MKLSKDPYKGTRDLYPEDYFVQRHIFSVWSKVAHRFGFQYYDAPLLEETALYAAKSGEEIVGEQTYSFEDRGGRNVTIRPEMTPSFARLVAKQRRELAYPVRWFSYPNMYRYEKPQRGRLREHWQLNVDIAGAESLRAERELIELSCSIMKEFGATDAMFEVRLSSRRLINGLFEDLLRVSEESAYRLSKLMDKKNKMPAKEFWAGIAEHLNEEQTNYFRTYIEATSMEDLASLPGGFLEDNAGAKELRELFALLEDAGVHNVCFDPTLMRGFDYYTGVIFEIFDLHPDNNRSLFGGGRYDDLVSIFGVEPVTCVGFGMGDVTIRDFMDTHGLLPAYTPNAHVYLCIQDDNCAGFAHELAKELRSAGVCVLEELDMRKVKVQMKTADKLQVPYVICIGEKERETNFFELKNMQTGATFPLGREMIVGHVLGA